MTDRTMILGCAEITTREEIISIAMNARSLHLFARNIGETEQI